MRLKIGIDYGHGAETPTGAKRYTFTDVEPHDEVVEGRLNRDLALEVFALLLEEPDLDVYDLVAGKRVSRIHSLEPKDVSLAARVKRANRVDLDLVLSIHTNAIGKEIEGPSLSARGFRAFTSPGRTKADTVAASISRAVAEIAVLAAGPVKIPVRSEREARFYVLTQTRAPAVLVEGGFFTNRDDVALLRDADFRRSLATAYVQGALAVLR